MSINSNLGDRYGQVSHIHSTFFDLGESETCIPRLVGTRCLLPVPLGLGASPVSQRHPRNGINEKHIIFGGPGVDLFSSSMPFSEMHIVPSML